MNRKHLISTGLALAIVLVLTSKSNACLWSRSFDANMGGPALEYFFGPALTSSEQDEIKKIEEKYQEQLAEKEAAIRETATELQAAEKKDSTTLGGIKNLSNTLYAYEKDYWSLRDTVNQEIQKSLGNEFYGNMGWKPYDCIWHNNHRGMYDISQLNR